MKGFRVLSLELLLFTCIHVHPFVGGSTIRTFLVEMQCFRQPLGKYFSTVRRDLLRTYAVRVDRFQFKRQLWLYEYFLNIVQESQSFMLKKNARKKDLDKKINNTRGD